MIFSVPVVFFQEHIHCIKLPLQKHAVQTVTSHYFMPPYNETHWRIKNIHAIWASSVRSIFPIMGSQTIFSAVACKFFTRPIHIANGERSITCSSVHNSIFGRKGLQSRSTKINLIDQTETSKYKRKIPNVSCVQFNSLCTSVQENLSVEGQPPACQ